MKHDLRYFLQSLKKQAPELLRQVKREVSPQWELSAVQKRLEVQKRLPVLSFDRVTGSKMPVVTNLFASRAHLALALEVSPDEVVARFAEAQKNGLPTKTVSTDRFPHRFHPKRSDAKKHTSPHKRGKFVSTHWS